MPIKLFARYGFKTSDYLKKVECPVLIIHSRNDEIVPFEFGLRLYEEAVKEPKKFIEISGSHNDGFMRSERIYRQGMRDWLESLENYRQSGLIIQLYLSFSYFNLFQIECSINN